MRRGYWSLLLIVLPLAFVCAVAGIGLASLLEDDIAEAGSALFRQPASEAEARRRASPAPLPLMDSSETMAAFHSVALGFSLDYPQGWRKREKTLQVIFAPSANGLDPAALQESVVWVGIPAGNQAEPAEVLAEAITSLPAGAKAIRQDQLNLAGQAWLSAQLQFEAEGLGGPALANVAVTSKNGVGYFLIAIAPEARWPAMEPLFKQMMDSFQFIAEAEIPPTPTGPPPPTPTATPTPVIYVVQPGDTLSGIAARYGVDMEALATRNDIDRPESLRSGEKLVIPIRRR